MKYIALLDSEYEFTEEVIDTLKNTDFLGDNPHYAFEILSIEKHKIGYWTHDDRCSCCRSFGNNTKYCAYCGAKLMRY